jgi:hypothetical protein
MSPTARYRVLVQDQIFGLLAAIFPMRMRGKPCLPSLFPGRT